jgi:hypothetical protein
LDNGVASLPKLSIYVSENSSSIGLQYACRQIGLPLTSIRQIPTLAASTNNNIDDKHRSSSTIDLAVLQQKISEDIASNCVPLFIVIDLGTSICGNIDNIEKIQELCQQNKIWLHLRGHSLAALSIQSENRAVSKKMWIFRWVFS